MNEQPIDPEVAELLATIEPAEKVPAEKQTIAQLRQTMKDAIARFTDGAAPIEVGAVTDELVPGRDERVQVKVRVYRPSGDPTAMIVYLHGGAWMVGDVDTHDLVTRRLARDTGATVVSVDYRMLPEHLFPAPLDDAYDAVVWARELAPELPLLVAGDSAGGTLTACVALRARDENGPRIDAQVLVYPGVDDDIDTDSMMAMPETREDLEFYFRAYASSPAALASPYALPGRATSLTGLPPAVVAVAGHDPLRTSNEQYAQRLEDAEVPVTVQLDLDLTHGWIDYAPAAGAADRAFRTLTDSINRLIGSAGDGA